MNLFIPNQVMPVCFFPTTILALDDDKTFLKNLVALITEKYACQTFSDPNSALSYLNTLSKNTIMVERILCKSSERSRIEPSSAITPNRILNQIYNPNRFSDIVSLVADYAMPGKNGIDFFVENPNENITAILLTGEADSEVALSAFKAKIINHFIRKDEENDHEKLLEYITKGQEKSFENASYDIAAALAVKIRKKAETFCLFDKNFITQTKKVMQEHEMTEYYIIDNYGSYLVLSKAARPTILWVRDNTDQEKSIIFAKTHNAPQSVVDRLTRHTAILTCDLEHHENTFQIDWEKILLSSGKISDFENYHVFIDHDIGKIPLNLSNVLSYEKYLMNWSAI